MPSRSPPRLPPRSLPRSPERSAPGRARRLAGRAGSRHGHPLLNMQDNKAEQAAETRAVRQLPEDCRTEDQSGCLALPHYADSAAARTRSGAGSPTADLEQLSRGSRVLRCCLHERGPAPGGRRRRRVRRDPGDARPGPRGCRHHDRGPDQSPSVPAAVVSGRHRDPPRWPHRAGAAQRGREAGQRARRAGRRAAPGPGRPGRAGPGPGRPGADAAVRQPGGRGRVHGRLLRARRMGGVRAGPEDAGGCRSSPQPYPRRLRDGRAGHRPGRTGGVPDLRGDRSRTHRSRGGGPDRRASTRDAAAGVQIRDDGGSEDPADRGGAAGARRVRPPGCSATRSGDWRRWASRYG